VADVYRKGTKSVHRAIVLDGHRFDVLGCNLDPGGEWASALPEGPKCTDCFGAGAAAGAMAPGRAARRQTRRQTAAVGGASALALAAAVWATPSQPVTPIASLSPTGGALLPTLTAIVTPEPTRVPPTPSTAPALTPSPAPTFGPEPTPIREVVYIVLPQPTPAPTQKQAPTPKPCVHPGTHLGADACKWPHN